MNTTIRRTAFAWTTLLLVGLPTLVLAEDNKRLLASAARSLRQQPEPVEPGELSSSANVARLASDGSVTGRLSLVDPMSGDVSPVQNIVVNFVQNGSIVSQTRPGNDGRFVVDGLSPGAYSVIANGPGGFAAFRIQVEPAAAGTRVFPRGEVSIQLVVLAQARPAMPGLQIDATVIPATDGKIIIAMYRAERLRQMTGGPFTTLRPGEVKYASGLPR
jgi:hypothetical protein